MSANLKIMWERTLTHFYNNKNFIWKSFINFPSPQFVSYNLGCVICVLIRSTVFLSASENVSFTLFLTHTDWKLPACPSNSVINIRNNYTCMYRITIVFTRFFRWSLFWAILTYLLTYLFTPWGRVLLD